MGITMSPRDYATAFHLLSTTSRHTDNIARVVQERILPRLPERPSLLDVGAGPGRLAQLLSPWFASLTLLEPNREQIATLELDGARILHETLESYHSSQRYEVVLCSPPMSCITCPSASGEGSSTDCSRSCAPGGTA